MAHPQGEVWGVDPPSFKTEPLLLKWSVQTVQVQYELLFQKSFDRIYPTSYWSQTGWLA